MNAAELLTNQKPSRNEVCAQHGEFEARHIFGRMWSGCPKCAAERESKELAEQQQREREREVAIWKRRLEQAGIPERFQDRSLKSYAAESEGQQRALAFAESYADRFDEALTTGRSAMFLGKIGTGKTHLAVGIGLRIMHRDGRTVLFSTVIRAIRRVKDTWGRDSAETETEAIAALVLPDLLILDEVGVQFGSETEKLILFDVLNERYEKRRPTLLLSNQTLDNVKAYLGERVFDRLREDDGEFVVFDWDSHRGAK